MKTKSLLLSFLLLSVCDDIHGQGSAVLQIIGGTTGPLVTDCETGQPVGPGFVAAIYWGPGGTLDRRNFTQIGAAASLINGRLFSGNRTITGIANGATISVYGAAWESALGPTYEAASLVPGAKVGQSAIIDVVTNPTTPVPVRIPDFQVCPIPEPSTLALGTLALASFWFFRRKSRKPVK